MGAFTLRKGGTADIGFIMETERQPGYEDFIGHYSQEQHLARLADPASAYLLPIDEHGEPQGFALVRDLDDGSGNIYVQRLAVKSTGAGIGQALLRLVIDWAFTEAGAHRLWLTVRLNNDRARYVYFKLGFVEEGIKRQASVLPDGSRVDLVMLSILRPEWMARH